MLLDGEFVLSGDIARFTGLPGDVISGLVDVNTDLKFADAHEGTEACSQYVIDNIIPLLPDEEGTTSVQPTDA